MSSFPSLELAGPGGPTLCKAGIYNQEGARGNMLAIRGTEEGPAVGRKGLESGEKPGVRGRRLAWGAALCAILVAGSAAAESVTIGPSKDNTIFEEGELSNGKGVYLFVGETANLQSRRPEQPPLPLGLRHRWIGSRRRDDRQRVFDPLRVQGTRPQSAAGDAAQADTRLGGRRVRLNASQRGRSRSPGSSPAMPPGHSPCSTPNSGRHPEEISSPKRARRRRL